jgi:hypothetical protein
MKSCPRRRLLGLPDDPKMASLVLWKKRLMVGSARIVMVTYFRIKTSGVVQLLTNYMPARLPCQTGA